MVYQTTQSCLLLIFVYDEGAMAKNQQDDVISLKMFKNKKNIDWKQFFA